VKLNPPASLSGLAPAATMLLGLPLMEPCNIKREKRMKKTLYFTMVICFSGNEISTFHAITVAAKRNNFPTSGNTKIKMQTNRK